jgi:RNA polymerase sigma-70 factor (ECF subfamily)
MLQAMAHDPFRSVPAEPALVDAGDRARALPVAHRASGGDRDAIAALLREHGQAVYQLCYHVAGPSDARDAAQEAFERIVTAIGSFDPSRGAFRPWALTVARNVCRDRLRRRGLERATFVADGGPPTAAAPSRSVDPERAALARGDAEALSRALEMLPEQMRSALVLFHLHEASYEEIAEQLEVPMGTVMTWLHRGRKRLREALTESAANGGEA